MFRFNCKDRVSSVPLLSSRLFDERTFYKAFLYDLKHCKTEVIIESPYMTTVRVAILSPTLVKLVKKGVKVRVHTRFPGHHDQQLRIQSWLATKSLKQIGVKVRFFNDYNHRKIAVIDGRILYEGSLNILSQRESREVMRRIESKELTKQMIKFLRLKQWHW